MKKWLITILVLLVLVVTSVYLFIPNAISVNQNIFINANQYGLHRNLFDEKNWPKWWPAGIETKDQDSLSHFIYNGYIYTIKEEKFSSLLIAITKRDNTTVTSLDLMATKLDSTKLDWEARIPTSYNPLKRLRAYFRAKQVSNDMKTILEKMQAFFSKLENVYDYDIRQVSVVDSTLISTFSTSKGYPDVEFIYGLIDQLKKYTALHSAKETGFPMLNVYTTDSINFLTKVAIPIDKKLPSSGNITYKWMLGHGDILITEVKGGSSAIIKAFQQIENYVTDYQRIAPAIPFQSLVTDRRQEPDTSKWITRIYYPVM